MQPGGACSCCFRGGGGVYCVRERGPKRRLEGLHPAQSQQVIFLGNEERTSFSTSNAKEHIEPMPEP